MPCDKKGDCEVGYGKPPRETRFVKGRSGNPRGRPPGAKSFSARRETGEPPTRPFGDPTIRRHGIACYMLASGL